MFMQRPIPEGRERRQSRVKSILCYSPRPESREIADAAGSRRKAITAGLKPGMAHTFSTSGLKNSSTKRDYKDLLLIDFSQVVCHRRLGFLYCKSIIRPNLMGLKNKIKKIGKTVYRQEKSLYNNKERKRGHNNGKLRGVEAGG